MKLFNPPSSLRFLFASVLALSAMLLSSFVAQAHPYASGVTGTNGAGVVSFVVNEAGATVYIVFDDNTTNFLGVLPKGATNFNLGSHTSFQIFCAKTGNGVPTQISTDADQWATYANPRGVAVNMNPKSTAFGRIYAGSSGTGGFAFGSLGYKPQGVFYFNADYSSGPRGTNPVGTFGSSGPWKMRVAADDDLLVGDFSGNGSLYKFSPDLSSSNAIFLAAQPAGIHGDGRGTPMAFGSLAQGNLTLWVPDSGMGVPAAVPTLGPNTHVGDFNCVYRYDIGAGPIPATGWPNPPNYAYTVGLSGIAELRPEVEIGQDGKIIAAFGRGNLSNPDIQILSPDGLTPVWDSWNDTAGASDPWNGSSGSGAANGTESVRLSPDGRFLASLDFNSGVTVALMTNGIPDDGSIFGIANTPSGATSRGISWDAADNLYVNSSGQLLLRTYSLGITTTCVTSNDFSGTNGSFQLILPSAAASGFAAVSKASQNYGTPIPGVFRITLNTNNLTLNGAVTVNFTRGGTAVYTNHYTINTNETPNGVIINPNSVTFPAGPMPGGGNWSVDVKITPTLNVASTNTLTVILTVVGGPTYQAVAPVKDTITIQNTGPQLLLLTAAGNGTTMYRGITNDYAKFIITRLGDTNGPGNSLGNVTPRVMTVTNVTYFGTAVFPTDYGARAQRLDPAGDGVIVPPTSGPTAIVFNPGDTTVTCVVGNPVAHADFNSPPVDVTIVANLTNAVSGAASTNGLLSFEGLAYNVNTAQITLTELDNRVGPEVLLYSNPLTNAADSVNWTLTFASTNFGGPQLPLVFPNYDNVTTFGTNDYFVNFGYDPSADGITRSIAMANSNWNGVLKMTVNKSAGAPEGVNVYPQGQNFHGNYALRFNLYMSLYDFALNNPSLVSQAREFALFGVNHNGTNCIWRPDVTITGFNAPTNSDGVWIAVDASSGSITPADYESYVPGPLPNNANGTVALPSKVSTPSSGVNGILKHPPFDAANVTVGTISAPGGGEPAGKWVDVSVEITKQTNVNFFINRSQILSFPLTNGGGLSASYTNGTIMLGYQDPNANVSDSKAFAYFSNVRVVELSPYILAQPGVIGSGASNLLVLPGSSLTFTSSASFASAPITNIWYKGTGAFNSPATGVPTAALQTNTVNATSMTDSITRTFTTAVDATNYMSVFSDQAGSVTSSVVAVEIALATPNKVTPTNSTTSMAASLVGPVTPTVFQWYFNTVSNLSTATKLAPSAHYGPVVNSSLFITNITSADIGFYWPAVTNSAGQGVVPAAGTLSLTVNPASVVVTPASQTNVWGSNTIFTVTASGTTPFTYQWKKAGVNLTNSTHIGGATGSVLSLTNITAADSGTYTAAVTNAGGGATANGVLVEFTPAPQLTGVSVVGGNTVLSLTSTNGFDKTASFTLQSAGDVTGPYTNNTTGAFTGSNGSFQITIPATGDRMFYRVLHAN
jgi:hypothetical protein